MLHKLHSFLILFLKFKKSKTTPNEITFQMLSSASICFYLKFIKKECNEKLDFYFYLIEKMSSRKIQYAKLNHDFMLSKITVKNKPRPLIGLFCIDIVKSCDRIGQEPNSLLRVNLEDDFLLSKIENSLHFSE